MICPTCGKELPDGSRFCQYCGAVITENSEAPQPFGQTANQYGQPQNQYSQPYTQDQYSQPYTQPQNQYTQPNLSNQYTQPYGQPYTVPGYSQANPAIYGEVKNIKEYVKKVCSPKCKSSFNSVWIMTFVLAGLGIVLALATDSDAFSLLDYIIVASLGLWFMLTGSKASGICLAVLSILEVVLGFVLLGSAGWLWIIIAIDAIAFVSKSSKSFKNFKENGTLDNWAQGLK